MTLITFGGQVSWSWEEYCWRLSPKETTFFSSIITKLQKGVCTRYYSKYLVTRLNTDKLLWPMPGKKQLERRKACFVSQFTARSVMVGKAWRVTFGKGNRNTRQLGTWYSYDEAEINEYWPLAFFFILSNPPAHGRLPLTCGTCLSFSVINAEVGLPSSPNIVKSRVKICRPSQSP